MFRSCRHLLLFVTTLVAAWVLVSPARAAAPLCDDRGAITFAPAPQLQAPATSVDVGADDDTRCAAPHAVLFAESGHGRTPPGPAGGLDPLAAVRSLGVAPSASVRLRAPGRGAPLVLPPGVRFGVERPPRS